MADETTSDDYDGRRDGPHRDRLNAAQKPRLRLLWWVKRYAITRVEWEAVKTSADTVIAMRRHKEQYVDNRGHMQNCPPWEGPDPDEPIRRVAGWRRQCDLMQVTAELVYHRGCDLSDYVYRKKQEAA